MTAVIAVVDTVFDQIEVHFGRNDTTIVWCDFNRNTFYEALNVLLLLVHEIFQRVHKLRSFILLKDMHRLLNCLHLFSSSELNIPEAYTLTFVLTRLLLVGRPGRPSTPVLWHLSNTTVTTAPRVRFDALDVLPERVRVERGFERAAPAYDSHGLDSVLILKKDFEGLVSDACLQSLHVPLVLLREDGLWNEEVGQLVGEEVDLELDLVRLLGGGVRLVRVDDCEGDSLDDLRGLRHLGAAAAVHGNQVERALAGEEHLDLLDAAANELALLDSRVLLPGHEAVAGEAGELAAEVVAAVLGQEVLVPLEEVKDEVVHLGVVGCTERVLVRLLHGVALWREQVSLFDL